MTNTKNIQEYALFVYHFNKELEVNSMASFQKRGNFWRYRISYFDDDHNRKYLTQSGFKTKAKAKVAATEEEYKIYAKSGSLCNRNFTFHKYYTNWVEVFKKPNVGKSSMNRFKNIGNVINNYFPNTKIKDVTPIEYQRFMNDYSKIRSTLTISKTNSIIRSCVKDAINDQIVASNFILYDFNRCLYWHALRRNCWFNLE